MSCRQATGRGGRGSGEWWRPRRKGGWREAGSARRSGRIRATGGVSTAIAAAHARAQTAATGFGAVSQSSCVCAAATAGSARTATAASVGAARSASRLCSGCSRAASATAAATSALRTTARFIAEITGIFTEALSHTRDRRQTKSGLRRSPAVEGAAISQLRHNIQCTAIVLGNSMQDTAHDFHCQENKISASDKTVRRLQELSGQ